MTNEEAIEIINRENDPNDKKVWEVFPEYKEALDLAIKALEQQPITTTNNDEPITVIYPTIVCDDAISRQVACDAIRKYKSIVSNPDAYDKAFDDGIDTAIAEIGHNVPLVTPRQKYGKWIEHPEIETSAPEYLMFYECSECGDKPCFCKPDIHKKRFCSNCGARMVEPQESEEQTE